MQKHEDLSELCIKRHSTSSLPSGYTYCNSHNVLWEEGTTVWCKSVWMPHLWKCDVREILSSLPHPHMKLAQIIKGRDNMAEINSLISSWHFIIDNTSREHLTKTSKLNKPKAVALTVQAWRHTNLHSMLCKRKGVSEEVLLVWNQGLNYCIFFSSRQHPETSFRTWKAEREPSQGGSGTGSWILSHPWTWAKTKCQKMEASILFQQFFLERNVFASRTKEKKHLLAQVRCARQASTPASGKGRLNHIDHLTIWLQIWNMHLKIMLGCVEVGGRGVNRYEEGENEKKPTVRDLRAGEI